MQMSYYSSKEGNSFILDERATGPGKRRTEKSRTRLQIHGFQDDIGKMGRE